MLAQACASCPIRADWGLNETEGPKYNQVFDMCQAWAGCWETICSMLCKEQLNFISPWLRARAEICRFTIQLLFVLLEFGPPPLTNISSLVTERKRMNTFYCVVSLRSHQTANTERLKRSDVLHRSVARQLVTGPNDTPGSPTPRPGVEENFFLWYESGDGWCSLQWGVWEGDKEGKKDSVFVVRVSGSRVVFRAGGEANGVKPLLNVSHTLFGW